MKVLPHFEKRVRRDNGTVFNRNPYTGVYNSKDLLSRTIMKIKRKVFTTSLTKMVAYKNLLMKMFVSIFLKGIREAA